MRYITTSPECQWPLCGVSQLVGSPSDRASRTFHSSLKRIADVTYVRLNIFPDGGVARLHVFSTLG